MLNILSPVRAAAIVAASVCLILSAVFTVADDDCPHIKPKTILCPGHTATNCAGTKWVIVLGIPVLVCDPATYKSVNSHPFTNETNGSNETNTAVDNDPDNKVTCWETGLCLVNPFTGMCGKLPFSADHKVNPLIMIDC